ncbi:hypothetical protein N2W52_002077 [Clostridium perfringens]|nr:hypothetical protein [Clostridium perfringens]
MIKIIFDSLTIDNKIVTKEDIFRGVSYNTDVQDSEFEEIENIKTGEVLRVDKYLLECCFIGC